MLSPLVCELEPGGCASLIPGFIFIYFYIFLVFVFFIFLLFYYHWFILNVNFLFVRVALRSIFI